MPSRPIYYDTETTGLRAEHDHIIEIAAYDPVNERTFHRLINPGRPIPTEATAIHHISDAMVSACPTFATIGQEFISFCEGDSILIAHNNDTFDMLFLRSEFKRHQIEMPSWKFLDTLKWARRYRPDLPRHTLQYLREMYGIPANTAHRALDDVVVLHQVFSKMTDDLHIDQVYQLLSKPREMTHMPFGKHAGKPLSALPRDYVQWLASSGALDKPENKELAVKLKEIHA